MTKPRVKVPKTALVGEIITIKAIISHRMHSGHGFDQQGNTIPKSIINTFKCEFNDKLVFACDLYPAMSSNPYFQFHARVDEAGTFTFTWIDDDGTVTVKEQSIALA